MFLIRRFALVAWFATLAFFPAIATASQVYGHLYFAEIMLDSLAGHSIAMQHNTRSAFLLGSISPDAAWVAHLLTQPEARQRLSQKYEVKFPSKYRQHLTYIDDIHTRRPTDFSLQLVALAVTAEEKAFAIGWLSHYAVDSFIHDLINHHGGYVSNPDLFDSAGIKTHDKLEAWEMRHVLQLDGHRLRNEAAEMYQEKLPLSLLFRTYSRLYPLNHYYQDHPQDFRQYMALGSQLMLDSTRWYGYQSEHTPAEIYRMKKLIRRFRPRQGRLLEVLVDLPSQKEYEAEKSSFAFLIDWQSRSLQVAASTHSLLNNAVAYYWWRDRNGSFAGKMADDSLQQLRKELQRINPADNLMLPRQNIQ
jgi:hypothetical protein